MLYGVIKIVYLSASYSMINAITIDHVKRISSRDSVTIPYSQRYVTLANWLPQCKLV